MQYDPHYFFMETKACSKCGITKPLDQFYGRIKQSQCIDCRLEESNLSRRKAGVPERRENFVNDTHKRCPNCGQIKPLSEFYRRNEVGRENQYKSNCASCIRFKAEKSRRARGVKSYTDNKKCPMYLGVAVAEEFLIGYFKHVERMPPCHKGWDFICDKGYKVDVKASTRHCRNTQSKNPCENQKAGSFI